MDMTNSKLITIFQLFLINYLVLLVSPAYAYLDPGTGSAILQGVIGALAAIGVVAKLYWHRLMRFFGIRKNKGYVISGSEEIINEDREKN
jgi:hypothetical protein